jgi:hypothetical protein
MPINWDLQEKKPWLKIQQNMRIRWVTFGEPQDEVVLESFKVQEVKHYKARCVWIFEF